MSVLLYVLGVVCVLGGALAILFGIPVKEFSFGDALIVAGTTGAVGGLILVGLGAAVAQLHRIAELLGARPLARAGQPLETGVRLGAGRVPFPPKPKAEPRARPVEMPVMPRPADKGNDPDVGLPPLLRNPEVPLMAAEEAEQLPLSPREAETAHTDTPVPEMPPPPEPRPLEPTWRSPPPPPRPPQPSYFEKMWPSPEREPAPPEGKAISSSPESIERAPSVPDDNEPVVEEPGDEVQPVAVLKSGVVDGMGYTLYVDGSIEAELPDGTLRFASINELRAHLEKGS